MQHSMTQNATTWTPASETRRPWVCRLRIPAAPLVSAVRGRVRRNGWITIGMADRLAAELIGENPATIWRVTWWDVA